jgi:hypothetical protein
MASPHKKCNRPDRDEVARLVGQAASSRLEPELADALEIELDRYEERAREIAEVKETERPMEPEKNRALSGGPGNEVSYARGIWRRLA